MDLLKYISSIFGPKGVSINNSAKRTQTPAGKSIYGSPQKAQTPIGMLQDGNYSDAASRAIEILAGGSDGKGVASDSAGGMGMMGIKNVVQGANGQSISPPTGSIVTPVVDDSAARMQAAQQLMNSMLASRRTRSR